MSDPRDHFRNQKFIMLTSYKKNGAGVDTEMWFVLEDGRLFVRTDVNHYKVKRIRRNPTVKVAPCDFTGKTTVEPFTARAVELPASEEPRLAKLFAQKFPMGYYLEILILKPFSGVLAALGIGKGRGKPVFYEILPRCCWPSRRVESVARCDTDPATSRPSPDSPSVIQRPTAPPPRGGRGGRRSYGWEAPAPRPGSHPCARRAAVHAGRGDGRSR